MSGKLLHFHTMQELSLTAADRVIAVANKAIEERGVFRIALAGGSTPRGLYEVLSDDDHIARTDWSHWHVYFGDERVVPLDDERSNYLMIHESLLSNVPIASENIFIPPVQLQNSRDVAIQYENILRDSFNQTDGFPHFDLILLGLGSDGHTASLFPEKPALNETERLVIESSPGILPPTVDRITFTLPLINAARHCLFLVAGNDKHEAFVAAYNNTPLNDVTRVPASMVTLKMSEWFVTDNLLK